MVDITAEGEEDTMVVTATGQGPGAALEPAEITMVCLWLAALSAALDTSLDMAA